MVASDRTKRLTHGRILTRDDAGRDAIAFLLMRYRDWNGQGWADIIDLLRMYPTRGAESCGRSMS
jgi:hypothetical protein